MERIKTYEPSGDSPVSAYPLGIVAGLAVAILGGWIYQAFVDWVPFIYVTFIATGGYGFAIGWVVGRAMQTAKCRNVLATVAIAAVCALIGVGVTYQYSYLRATADAYEEELEELENVGGMEVVRAALEAQDDDEAREALEQLQYLESLEKYRELVTMGEYIDLKVENGWEVGRSSSGIPIKGLFVWIVWLLELGLVVGLAVVFAPGAVSAPFCEQCDRWLEESGLASVRAADAEGLQTAVHRGDLGALLLPDYKAGSRKTANYSMHACDNCDGRFVTVKLKWQQRGEKGKMEEQEAEVIEHAVATPAQVDTLLRHVEQMGPPPTGKAKKEPDA